MCLNSFQVQLKNATVRRGKCLELLESVQIERRFDSDLSTRKLNLVSQ